LSRVRFNFPLFLTWCRIVAIPLFVAVLYVPEDWIAEKTRNVISMWIFIGAAVTDWLDGYLARRWNQTTSFGAFLDPVADKLMVAAALIVLTEFGRIYAIVAHHHRARDHHFGAARMDGAIGAPRASR
jgi:CDP-diacylglycerol--glycerol-3-phosphate 3-phosphatidyltransferase